MTFSGVRQSDERDGKEKANFFEAKKKKRKKDNARSAALYIRSIDI